MARTSNLANVATVSRATKAWYPGGWDFTNGGSITGDLVEYANNVARDGSSGLLVEEDSTNKIRNPRAEGAAAGTPGTLPSNWSSNLYSSTQEVIGSGYENGWPYVDVKFTGTPTDNIEILFEQTSVVSAASGETWTVSSGVKLLAGDLTNITGLRLRLDGNNGATFEERLNGTVETGVDFTHRRFSFSGTFADASTAHAIPKFVIVHDGSGAIDITLRIYAPQLEQKAYPTSPVLPPESSPAASDREADDIEVGNGAWVGSDSHTIYLDLDGVAGVGVPLVLYDSTNPFNDRVTFEDGGDRVRVTEGGSVLALRDPAGDRDPSARLAFACGGGSSAYSISGLTQAGSLAITTTDVGLNTIQIGNLFNLNLPIRSGYIKQLRYWPRRLSNAELEALVGN